LDRNIDFVKHLKLFPGVVKIQIENKSAPLPLPTDTPWRDANTFQWCGYTDDMHTSYRDAYAFKIRTECLPFIQNLKSLLLTLFV